MKNQTIENTNQKNQIISQFSDQSISNLPNKPNLKKPILITLLVSGIFFGFGGYFLRYLCYEQSNLSLNQEPVNDLVSPAPSISPTKEVLISTTPESLEDNFLPSSTPTDARVNSQDRVPSEIGNQTMIKETKKISSDGKYQVWLDGLNNKPSQMWVSQTDGTQKSPLVITAINNQNEEIGDFYLSSPVWSPDGTRIAYYRVVLIELTGFEAIHNLDLHVVNRDGSNDQLILANVETPMYKINHSDLEWTEKGISYTDSHSIEGAKKIIEIN